MIMMIHTPVGLSIRGKLPQKTASKPFENGGEFTGNSTLDCKVGEDDPSVFSLQAVDDQDVDMDKHWEG